LTHITTALVLTASYQDKLSKSVPERQTILASAEARDKAGGVYHNRNS